MAVVFTAAVMLLAACTGSSTSVGPTETTLTGIPALSRPATTGSAISTAVASGPTMATSADPSGPTAGSATPDATGDLRLTTIATGLDVPWGLTFLPDETAIVTGRDDGSISAIAPDGSVREIGVVDDVDHGGEGGLLGVAASPNFDRDNSLYVYYTTATDNRIASLTLENGALGNQRVLLQGIPKGGIHNGGRLAFGPDGLLYAGTGDSGERSNAQDLNSLGGKILRLAPDGSPATGNPFHSAPYVYSYGHRNVQGLAFDDSGRLWASEFGQNTWDELNLIVAGGNYGWPVVEGPGVHEGFVEPVRVWSTDQASPSGIAVWQGSVWMAGLRGQRLWQIPISDAAPSSGPGATASAGGASSASGASSAGGATSSSGTNPTGEPIAQLTGVYGRLRTVQVAPDGSLWVSTSNTDGRGDVRDGDDRILRIERSP
jgi:glucose/arabinose dehydrogenase